MDTRLEGAPSGGNRWQRLLSIIGILSTVSGIVGELTGYFSFLRNTNALIDALINYLANSISGHQLNFLTLLALKLMIALAITWFLFFVALKRYAVAYERASLREWIEEVNLFFFMEKTKRESKLSKILITIFLSLPLSALAKAITPPWHPGRLLVMHRLQIKLWAFLAEVVFLHAVIFFSVMAFSLIYRMGRAVA